MRKIQYILLAAGLMLAACKGQNEAEEPQPEPQGRQEITLHFSMESDITEPSGAEKMPLRIPGDPGKDDFIAPTNLYFILWVETKDGNKKMMTAVQETGLSATDWEPDGLGVYTLKNKSYKLVIPKDNEQIQQLAGGVFHVFAFASTKDLSNVGSIAYTAFNETEKTNGRTITTTDTELATLEALTYSLPGGITTQEGKRDFFRSMYSTALSETSHNQMATSPTIRLRHTAARLDINWECDETIHTHGLTPNSTWTLALASNIMPTSFSLFQPGHNATGTASWSETITIDEGCRYNGRYVTYLPMPTTPTFTVTSMSNVDKLDGDNYVKTMPLSAGADTNYATWMRALWTIK